jgi:hypothetical protein
LKETAQGSVVGLSKAKLATIPLRLSFVIPDDHDNLPKCFRQVSRDTSCGLRAFKDRQRRAKSQPDQPLNLRTAPIDAVSGDLTTDLRFANDFGPF